MVHKKMETMEVYIYVDEDDEKFIAISQDVLGQREPDVVYVHLNQVETLIGWLNETKEEIEQKLKHPGESR
jgi:hypothetical protein